jgi:putative proteasome-type protease
MTYCFAVKLDSGIVFASDSRTNAEIDQISTYSKMNTFCVPGQRLFVLLSAGNLATTQAVVNLIRRDLEDPAAENSLNAVDYMFDAALYVGQTSSRVQERHRDPENNGKTNLEATFILAGQIKNQPHDIYLVYPEGNYISASPAQPYLQIGETKYGKPILDRVLTSETRLEDAARCALVSLDSTSRSNLSVGPPFELGVYEKDRFDLSQHIELSEDSPFYISVRDSWIETVQRGFEALPRFAWE